MKFSKDANDPSFKQLSADIYQRGLTTLRSAQCPYSVKNVDAIIETARRIKLPADLVELKDAHSVQQAPCAFGTFCIIKDGKVLSHQSISNTRFENIIKAVK
jgi:hypothetical protein